MPLIEIPNNSQIYGIELVVSFRELFVCLFGWFFLIVIFRNEKSAEFPGIQFFAFPTNIERYVYKYTCLHCVGLGLGKFVVTKQPSVKCYFQFVH